MPLKQFVTHLLDHTERLWAILKQPYISVDQLYDTKHLLMIRIGK